jgi:hypothetical protein
MHVSRIEGTDGSKASVSLAVGGGCGERAAMNKREAGMSHVQGNRQ